MRPGVAKIKKRQRPGVAEKETRQRPGVAMIENRRPPQDHRRGCILWVVDLSHIYKADQQGMQMKGQCARIFLFSMRLQLPLLFLLFVFCFHPPSAFYTQTPEAMKEESRFLGKGMRCADIPNLQPGTLTVGFLGKGMRSADIPNLQPGTLTVGFFGKGMRSADIPNLQPGTLTVGFLGKGMRSADVPNLQPGTLTFGFLGKGMRSADIPNLQPGALTVGFLALQPERSKATTRAASENIEAPEAPGSPEAPEAKLQTQKLQKLRGVQKQGLQHKSSRSSSTSRSNPSDTEARKMAQSLIESLFGDDPFFEPTYLLWPRRSTPVASLREHFQQRRAQLMENFRTDIREGLFRELTDGLHGDLFETLESLCSPSTSRISTSQSQDRTLAWTLDTQGFSPEEITVTVAGRKLEVMAAKASTQTDSPSEPKPAGFIQSVDLPDHIDPTALTCTQAEDGLLRIEAETKQDPSEERTVPIRFRTSLDFPLTRDNTSKTEDGLEKTS
ncbi:hypothetical protein NFI96_001415 [Prochilodus magdalenae]|nr:hypothetical protein NFI96_001415 [Prochilodus magdalenae]